MRGDHRVGSCESRPDSFILSSGCVLIACCPHCSPARLCWQIGAASDKPLLSSLGSSLHSHPTPLPSFSQLNAQPFRRWTEAGEAALQTSDTDAADAAQSAPRARDAAQPSGAGGASRRCTDSRRSGGTPHSTGTHTGATQGEAVTVAARCQRIGCPRVTQPAAATTRNEPEHETTRQVNFRRGTRDEALHRTHRPHCACAALFAFCHSQASIMSQ